MSFYDASVPAFLQILGSLSGILTKAETHCAAKNIQPEVLLARAALSGHAAAVEANSTGVRFLGQGLRPARPCRRAVDARHREDIRRIAPTVAKHHRLPQEVHPAQFEGGDSREVTFPIGPDKTLTLKGQEFLNRFAFTNFYFHADRPRHPASQWRRNRQARFSGRCLSQKNPAKTRCRKKNGSIVRRLFQANHTV